MQSTARSQVVNRFKPFAGHWATALLLLLLSCWSIGAHAHQAAQSYLFLDVAADKTTGFVELPVADLLEAVGSDHPIFVNGPERPAIEALQAYLAEHLSIAADGVPLEIDFTGVDTREIEIADFSVLSFRLLPAPSQPQLLTIRYDAILHALPDHRGGLVLENNYLTGMSGNHTLLSHWFAPGRETFDLKLAGRSLVERIWTFVILGVEHIWIGIDHVLFVVTLLLPAVLVYRSGGWAPTSTFRSALWQVVAVVTVFTIAHTITLGLALKGWVTLPSRFVESVIALSVLAVAIDNLRPYFGRWKWVIVFLFGLFHGLGFASVLEDLTLMVESKLISLIGFNIGVELGQLALVAVVFPLLFLLRRQHYVGTVLWPGSLAVAAIAGWWLISRALAIETPPWLPF